MAVDKEKALKLVIVALATLAALAVMSTLVQLIHTVLPFLIVGTGIYAGYRWALSDAPAPTADEVEEQARGLFSRFRRTKKAVETTMKAADVVDNLTTKPAEKEANPKDEAPQPRERKHRNRPLARKKPAEESPDAPAEADDRAAKARQMKQALESNPEGAVEFKDRDVVISAADIVQPDLSRLQEKEKRTPEVTSAVLSQIEERQRRLQNRG